MATNAAEALSQGQEQKEVWEKVLFAYRSNKLFVTLSSLLPESASDISNFLTNPAPAINDICHRAGITFEDPYGDPKDFAAYFPELAGHEVIWARPEEFLCDGDCNLGLAPPELSLSSTTIPQESTPASPRTESTALFDGDSEGAPESEVQSPAPVKLSKSNIASLRAELEASLVPSAITGTVVSSVIATLARNAPHLLTMLADRAGTILNGSGAIGLPMCLDGTWGYLLMDTRIPALRNYSGELVPLLTQYRSSGSFLPLYIEKALLKLSMKLETPPIRLVGTLIMALCGGYSSVVADCDVYGVRTTTALSKKVVEAAQLTHGLPGVLLFDTVEEEIAIETDTMAQLLLADEPESEYDDATPEAPAFAKPPAADGIVSESVEIVDRSVELETGEFAVEHNELEELETDEPVSVMEAERRALDADCKAAEEAEIIAREEADRLKEERLAADEAERLAREEVEAAAKAEEDAEAAEAERLAREEAERLAQEEAERKAEEARLEEERKAEEAAAEAERLAEEAKAAEEKAERKAKEEAAREEAERLAREEAERKAAEEARKAEAKRLAEEERLEAEHQAAEGEAQDLEDDYEEYSGLSEQASPVVIPAETSSHSSPVPRLASPHMVSTSEYSQEVLEEPLHTPGVTPRATDARPVAVPYVASPSIGEFACDVPDMTPRLDDGESSVAEEEFENVAEMAHTELSNRPKSVIGSRSIHVNDPTELATVQDQSFGGPDVTQAMTEYSDEDEFLMTSQPGPVLCVSIDDVFCFETEKPKSCYAGLHTLLGSCGVLLRISVPSNVAAHSPLMLNLAEVALLGTSQAFKYIPTLAEDIGLPKGTLPPSVAPSAFGGLSLLDEVDSEDPDPDSRLTLFVPAVSLLVSGIRRMQIVQCGPASAFPHVSGFVPLAARCTDPVVLMRHDCLDAFTRLGPAVGPDGLRGQISAALCNKVVNHFAAITKKLTSRKARTGTDSVSVTHGSFRFECSVLPALGSRPFSGGKKDKSSGRIRRVTVTANDSSWVYQCFTQLTRSSDVLRLMSTSASGIATLVWGSKNVPGFESDSTNRHAVPGCIAQAKQTHSSVLDFDAQKSTSVSRAQITTSLSKRGDSFHVFYAAVPELGPTEPSSKCEAIVRLLGGAVVQAVSYEQAAR